MPLTQLLASRTQQPAQRRATCALPAQVTGRAGRRTGNSVVRHPPSPPRAPSQTCPPHLPLAPPHIGQSFPRAGALWGHRPRASVLGHRSAGPGRPTTVPGARPPLPSGGTPAGAGSGPSSRIPTFPAPGWPRAPTAVAARGHRRSSSAPAPAFPSGSPDGPGCPLRGGSGGHGSSFAGGGFQRPFLGRAVVLDGRRANSAATSGRVLVWRPTCRAGRPGGAAPAGEAGSRPGVCGGGALLHRRGPSRGLSLDLPAVRLWVAPGRLPTVPGQGAPGLRGHPLLRFSRPGGTVAPRLRATGGGAPGSGTPGGRVNAA